MFLIWGICALVTWLVMITLSDFILWDDDPVAITIGLVISFAMCAMMWPFVVLAGVGSLISALK